MTDVDHKKSAGNCEHNRAVDASRSSSIAEDPYHYARDHDRGPGAWCVRGPNEFKVTCDEKNCAYMLGKLLSGQVEDAAKMARSFVDIRERAIWPT